MFAEPGAIEPRIVVVTGPTAVGKSELALELADRLGGEIISADSRQVYRFMDVGTAKPSLAERAQVPHHLLDVVYPDEPYSIARFQEEGERMLADLADRSKVALIVGGSPHYIQALVDRLQPAPRAPELRNWLEQEDSRHPPEHLNRWLRELDPSAADTIELRNRRRVLRAIEVCLATGRPFTVAGRERAEPRRAVWIGLRRERADLHERVARRVEAMLRAGWLEEVRTLLLMGYAPSLPSMSATGYAELARVVQGTLSLDDAVTRIRHTTHAFIRRQDAWLRAEPRLRWLDAEDPATLERVLVAIRSGLAA
jgi:tRNA dimethylallyltransferase